MDFDQIVSNAAWTILAALSDGDKSPGEIAKATGLSPASVSQQAKLLVAYNMISSEKQPRAAPGKPKQLYSLNKELAYLVLLRKGFAGKRILKLDDFRKSRINLCFLESGEDQYFLEKFYFEREDFLIHCDVVAVSDSNGREIHLLVLTDETHLEKIRKEMSHTTIKHVLDKKDDRKIICWTHTLREIRDGYLRGDEYFTKLLDHPHVLIDRRNVLSEFVRK